MEQHSQVFDVVLLQDDGQHRASYFIEENTIHANIGGRLMTVPLGPVSAADTVKSLLSGYLAQRARKRALQAQWSA